MQKIAIVTGGSRGLGKAFCKKYLEKGYEVFSIARTQSNLENVRQVTCNLANSEEVTAVFTQLFSKITQKEVAKIILINNAGTLGTIAPIHKNSPQSIATAIQVNVTAVLQIVALFIKHTQHLTSSKKIINISSGAALKPYEGWSVYCASKSAVDMLTKVVAKEQESVENGISISAIYPGVVNTQMQTTIRNTPKEDFPSYDKFFNLYKNNELLLPDDVAEKVFSLEHQNILKNGDVVDIRDVVI